MIKAVFLNVQASSRREAEEKLVQAFNEWTEENSFDEIIKFLEPVRFDRKFGDFTDNSYHTQMTFFYRLS